MKRKLLPLAVAAAMGMSGVAMAEGVNGPKVYGKAKIAFGSYDTDTYNAEDNTTENYKEWNLKSFASRFGVKGDAKLNNDMKAFYKFEWEVDLDDDGSMADDGKNDDLKERNRYVGLAFGNAGSVKFGHFDTPVKVSQGKVDLYGDFQPDIAKDDVFKGDNRRSNQINYTSPKIADSFAVSVSVFPGEGGSADGNSTDDGIADYFSMNATYAANGLYLAFATESDVYNKVAEDHADVTRLVANYEGDGFTVGGMYEMGEAEDEATKEKNESTMLLLSGKFGLTETLYLKGQIATGEEESSSPGSETTTGDVSKYTFGVEQKMGKKTSGQVYYSTFEREKDEERTELVFALTHSF